MLGDHTQNHPTINNEHRMILLQDIDDRLNIHIRGHGGKTGFGEVPYIEGLHPVQTLLLNCLHNNRF